MWNLMDENAIDKHSKKNSVDNFELFLNYCVRFYDRQVITRDNGEKGILDGALQN